MRIAYAGTPDFAVPALQGLIDAGVEIVGVWTQPDRPAGRGRKLTASPVKQTALTAGLTVYQPESLKDPEAQAELLNSGADLLVVAAYGLLLPKPIIDGFALGCVNLHGSLLPRWRGAAPIQRAIEAGDAETGLGLMRMEEGLDTGAVIGEIRTPIDVTDTALDVHDRLAAMGWPLLQAHWSDLQNQVPGTTQPETGVLYAKKLSKAEAQLDFSWPAERLRRQIHAFNPAPGAWVDGEFGRIKLHRAEVLENPGLEPGQIGPGPDHLVGTGAGALRILEWQFAGQKRQPLPRIAQSNRLVPGRFLQ